MFTRFGLTLEVNSLVSNGMMVYIAKKQKSLGFILFCPNSCEISWLRLGLFFFSNLSLHLLCASVFLEATSYAMSRYGFPGKGLKWCNLVVIVSKMVR